MLFQSKKYKNRKIKVFLMEIFYLFFKKKILFSYEKIGFLYF